MSRFFQPEEDQSAFAEGLFQLFIGNPTYASLSRRAIRFYLTLLQLTWEKRDNDEDFTPGLGLYLAHSRPELSEISGSNIRMVTLICRELVKAGLIIEKKMGQQANRIYVLKPKKGGQPHD